MMDAATAEKINKLAETLKKNGLAPSMEDAIAKATEIILGRPQEKVSEQSTTEKTHEISTTKEEVGESEIISPAQKKVERQQELTELPTTEKVIEQVKSFSDNKQSAQELLDELEEAPEEEEDLKAEEDEKSDEDSSEKALEEDSAKEPEDSDKAKRDDETQESEQSELQDESPTKIDRSSPDYDITKELKTVEEIFAEEEAEDQTESDSGASAKGDDNSRATLTEDCLLYTSPSPRD